MPRERQIQRPARCGSFGQRRLGRLGRRLVVDFFPTSCQGDYYREHGQRTTQRCRNGRIGLELSGKNASASRRRGWVQ